MSEAQTPLERGLDAQRRFLRQSQRAVRSSAGAQRRLARAFANSLDAQRAVGQQATETMDSALEGVLIASRRSTGRPGDHEQVEAAFADRREAVEQLEDDWWALFSRSLATGVDTFDGATRLTADLADAWFDAALEANSQFAANVSRLSRPPAEPIDVDVEGSER